MTIKLICKDCGSDWEEVGNAYKRTKGDKIDFYCSCCKSKRKPVREKFIGFESGGLVDCSTLKMHDDFGNTEALVKPPVIDITKVEEIIKRIAKSQREQNNMLVIGDIHEPFSLKGYREFCYEMYLKYNCNSVMFMGDIIDQHYSSFHNTDPDGMGGGDELDFAIAQIQLWYKLFPDAKVCMGNHDKIILRKAFAAGISKRWIKDFKDVLKVSWDFRPSFVIDNVLYRHGLGQKASPKAGSEMMNVVQGHFHTESYIHYRVGSGKKVFGAQCPCGIDREAYALAYAEEHPKPAIGCMVVLENGRLPILEMMDL